jgi:hypothetical protein
MASVLVLAVLGIFARLGDNYTFVDRREILKILLLIAIFVFGFITAPTPAQAWTLGDCIKDGFRHPDCQKFLPHQEQHQSQSQQMSQSQDATANASNVNINLAAPSISLGCQSSALAISGATGQYNGIHADSIGATLVFGLGRKPDCTQKPTQVIINNILPTAPTPAPVVMTQTVVKYRYMSPIVVTKTRTVYVTKVLHVCPTFPPGHVSQPCHG